MDVLKILCVFILAHLQIGSSFNFPWPKSDVKPIAQRNNTTGLIDLIRRSSEDGKHTKYKEPKKYIKEEFIKLSNGETMVVGFITEYQLCSDKPMPNYDHPYRPKFLYFPYMPYGGAHYDDGTNYNGEYDDNGPGYPNSEKGYDDEEGGKGYGYPDKSYEEPDYSGGDELSGDLMSGGNWHSGSKGWHSGSKGWHSGSKGWHSGSKGWHSGSKGWHSGSKGWHSGGKKLYGEYTIYGKYYIPIDDTKEYKLEYKLPETNGYFEYNNNGNMPPNPSTYTSTPINYNIWPPENEHPNNKQHEHPGIGHGQKYGRSQQMETNTEYCTPIKNHLAIKQLSGPSDCLTSLTVSPLEIPTKSSDMHPHRLKLYKDIRSIGYGGTERCQRSNEYSKGNIYVAYTYTAKYKCCHDDGYDNGDNGNYSGNNNGGSSDGNGKGYPSNGGGENGSNGGGYPVSYGGIGDGYPDKSNGAHSRDIFVKNDKAYSRTNNEDDHKDDRMKDRKNYRKTGKCVEWEETGTIVVDTGIHEYHSEKVYTIKKGHVEYTTLNKGRVSIKMNRKKNKKYDGKSGSNSNRKIYYWMKYFKNQGKKGYYKNRYKYKGYNFYKNKYGNKYGNKKHGKKYGSDSSMIYSDSKNKHGKYSYEKNLKYHKGKYVDGKSHKYKSSKIQTSKNHKHKEEKKAKNGINKKSKGHSHNHGNGHYKTFKNNKTNNHKMKTHNKEGGMKKSKIHSHKHGQSHSKTKASKNSQSNVKISTTNKQKLKTDHTGHSKTKNSGHIGAQTYTGYISNEYNQNGNVVTNQANYGEESIENTKDGMEDDSGYETEEMEDDSGYETEKMEDNSFNEGAISENNEEENESYIENEDEDRTPSLDNKKSTPNFDINEPANLPNPPSSGSSTPKFSGDGLPGSVFGGNNRQFIRVIKPIENIPSGFDPINHDGFGNTGGYTVNNNENERRYMGYGF